jgi:hypothetical protein
MWVSTLFDLGEAGTAILLILTAVAMWRLRCFALMAAVLLPFTVASMVNSSIPDYSFTVLGIMLYAFGWACEAEVRLVPSARRWGSAWEIRMGRNIRT